MREYITKAKVIEAIEKSVAPEITTIRDYETIGVFTRESIEQIVSNLPAADVAEVRHGRWFFKYPNGWACSRCGEWGLMIDNRGICKSSYCPNCGALMMEDEHEAG